MKWNIKKASTYAIIGARGGSKVIPKKNSKSIAGFPLIAYSIVAAKLTPSIERTIVSTDSQEIVDIAKKFGAEVPFLRPAELATDAATDRSFLVHALEWLQEHEGVIPEFLALLRPTSPLRDPGKITKAIEAIAQCPEATSLRSAHASATVPQKMFSLEGKFLVGLFPHDKRPEYHSLPRQEFPITYKPDGYVDVLRSECVLSGQDTTFGDTILAFMTPDTGDIDHGGDLAYVESLLQTQSWAVHEYLKEHYPSA